jgi:hypothetical protein
MIAPLIIIIRTSLHPTTLSQVNPSYLLVFAALITLRVALPVSPRDLGAIRLFGTLPIRESRARMRAQALRAAASKSGASAGSTDCVTHPVIGCGSQWLAAALGSPVGGGAESVDARGPSHCVSTGLSASAQIW